MSLADNAKAHFARKVDAGLKSIEVKEWAGNGHDGVIYYGPDTIESRDYYFNDLAASKFEGYAKLLIARARTKDGKPVFHKNELVEMRREYDTEVVTRVALAIFTDDELSVEEAGK